ncbi:hypothetical protein SELMODRAFT_125498 [Selaginella moellendorffii]|uniref:Pentatricopeptide repeat-containing protein n=2 Tax=Selaginella moellendorffii TaxID=88036 RepID=D8SUT3_SELML|nr:hypothetical protein SELMODRAFT_125498 [Selaginella moellendorffii]
MWEGFVPDESVFTGVLAACSHQGLLELGIRLFSLMVRDYSIAPALVHFKCLIALLTRAGQLDSAEQLLNEMPYHPDEVAWVTLLAGCSSHFDVGRASYATCNSSALHVLLGNVYDQQTFQMSF